MVTDRRLEEIQLLAEEALKPYTTMSRDLLAEAIFELLDDRRMLKFAQSVVAAARHPHTHTRGSRCKICRALNAYDQVERGNGQSF